MRKEDFLKPVNSELLGNSEINVMKSQKNSTHTLKTGTTTVGITVKDAVILGADKRASMSYFISNKNTEKIQKIQDHLWITIAGGVADALYLVDVLRAETTLFQLNHDGKPIKINSTGKLLSNILYQNKMFPFQVGLILGGVTEEEGPALLNISAYGSILKEKNYTCVGSGQNFSYGVLEAKYKDNLSIAEGKEIIRKAISSSIIRDMFSGNGIDIVVIKKEGFEREIIPI